MNVAEARKRLITVESFLNSIVVGHEEMIRGILVALIAGEHAMIIGAPGTAKTFTVHTIAKLLNAKHYSYLLTKFTDFSELFGPVDIARLAQGEYVRRWSAIVDSDIVFLDEIFNANSTILNALLSMLQERVVYDSMTGQMKEVRLWTAIGASNKAPADEELQALYDRFAVRIFVDYLPDNVMILHAIEAKWIRLNNGFKPRPIASMDDVHTLHDFAMSLITRNIQMQDLVAPLYKIYYVNVVPLVEMLTSKGIILSDRTIIEKLPKIYASYLALYGITMSNIITAPYEIIRWVVKDRNQLRDIDKMIDEAFGEVAELAKKLEEVRRLIKDGNLKMAKRVIEDILSYDISRIADKPWMKPKVEKILSEARSYLKKIEELENEMQKAFIRGSASD